MCILVCILYPFVYVHSNINTPPPLSLSEMLQIVKSDSCTPYIFILIYCCSVISYWKTEVKRGVTLLRKISKWENKIKKWKRVEIHYIIKRVFLRPQCLFARDQPRQIDVLYFSNTKCKNNDDSHCCRPTDSCLVRR